MRQKILISNFWNSVRYEDKHYISFIFYSSFPSSPFMWTLLSEVLLNNHWTVHSYCIKISANSKQNQKQNYHLKICTLNANTQRNFPVYLRIELNYTSKYITCTVTANEWWHKLLNSINLPFSNAYKTHSQHVSNDLQPYCSHRIPKNMFDKIA